MGLYISNIASMFALRHLNDAQNALDTSMKRLASGKRINSAKDDPAGFQIAHRLTSEIDGLTQGNRNAQDGLSLAQTAEGALDEMVNMMQRVRTLAQQSANGTNSRNDRIALNEEAKQLYEEINRISKDTTFAGEKILDGSKGEVFLQVGAYSGQGFSMNLSDGFTVEEMAKRVGGDTETTFQNGFDLTTSESSQNVLAHIDDLIGVVSAKQGELGGVQSRLESTIRYQSNSICNLSDARSRIEDTDYASEISNYIQKQIQMQAAMTVLSQANQSKNMILSLIQSAFG
ncbi:MAG: flagellin [Succinivibrionaceae bacterium]|nr:flagellin [Ruminobacter sp.]MDY5779480.1 flagellin [Succinivibrionaceae bacterium]MEE1341062.1 flagellin [Succinivibrionaceae bacterium]